MFNWNRIPRVTYPALALALILLAAGYFVRGINIPSVLRELQSYSFRMHETTTRDIDVDGQHPQPRVNNAKRRRRGSARR